MEIKNILFELRTKHGFSQGELAEKLYVTRQAVSRWENGETVPCIETLELLSKLFKVSINTLLGSPQKLVCKCCGKVIENDNIGKDSNGEFNEDYCNWCYIDGDFTMDFWKRYALIGGEANFDKFKKQIVNEINSILQFEGFPEIDNLNVLPGSFINLEYTLPNGFVQKFLDDKSTYFATQLENVFDSDRCIGIVAGMDFIIVSTYEENGKNPELVIYKKR